MARHSWDPLLIIYKRMQPVQGRVPRQTDTFMLTFNFFSEIQAYKWSLASHQLLKGNNGLVEHITLEYANCS